MPCVPTRNFMNGFTFKSFFLIFQFESFLSDSEPHKSPHVCHSNFSNVTSLEFFLILLGQNSTFLSFLIAVMQFREIKERKLREHIPARPANIHI